MSRPKVFISSTFRDLQDIREDLQEFISSMDFEPIAFEAGDIAFEPSKYLEDSCYSAIAECSMVVLVIKTNYGTQAERRAIPSEEEIYSITSNEYRVAQNHGIPVFVFINQSTHDEYVVYTKQNRPANFAFTHIDNPKIAKFIDLLYRDNSTRYIFKYNSTREIKKILRKQWSGLFYKYLENERRHSLRLKTDIRINPYKFFFLRHRQQLSQQQIARIANLKVGAIARIEDVALKARPLSADDFVNVTLDEASRIANALKCSVGNIRSGLPDEFLSQFIAYYYHNKGSTHTKVKGSKSKSIFATRAVFFDFDGTMTYHLNKLTSWELIWLELGYKDNECGDLHRQFSNHEISHSQWCKITEEKFRERRLKNTVLDKIARDIQLLPGVAETVHKLHDAGIPMFIVSGSIRHIIKQVLGELYEKFDDIKANDMKFGPNSELKSIIGTRYDFQGKAQYISQALKEKDIQPYEALFVGNSSNDEWAHQAGVQTLCINYSATNPDNQMQWHYSINHSKDFRDILQYVNLDTNAEEGGH